MDLSIIQKSKRQNLIRSTYKLIEKLFYIHTIKKISTEALNEKLEKLKTLLKSINTQIEDLNSVVIQRQDTDKELYVLINEHLLYHGYFETSKKFVKEFEIEKYNDYSFFKEMYETKQEIYNGKFDKVLHFCKEYKTTLKNMTIPIKNEYLTTFIKLNIHQNKENHTEFNCSDIENMFRVQEYIELCKNCKYKEAMLYAKETFCKNTFLIKPFLPLLVCRDVSTLKDQINNNYDLLVYIYSKSLYKIHKLSFESRLTRLVECGLIATKTRFCEKNKNMKCPGCMPFLMDLAAKLPFYKREQSILLCKGLDVEMNDRNQPYMFDSGYVYSDLYISETGHLFICKVTGEICEKKPRRCYFV
ncbi:hypothetical protein CWI37_0276p0020 [Hamiltosporidium tvaerminnensis]|uniref:CTLH/CRA C-terminal to LisH motif domain-containing protein n=1 Tax=Hamiltosporidium tvaerminnensis TaxID=1176355 RepID=A0A4Q9L8L5_9MICR|nr:hypothetical protein CWI37_0276p0020 [Hamiltosporidium tvaerminnensis]